MIGIYSVEAGLVNVRVEDILRERSSAWEGAVKTEWSGLNSAVSERAAGPCRFWEDWLVG